MLRASAMARQADCWPACASGPRGCPAPCAPLYSGPGKAPEDDPRPSEGAWEESPGFQLPIGSAQPFGIWEVKKTSL